MLTKHTVTLNFSGNLVFELWGSTRTPVQLAKMLRGLVLGVFSRYNLVGKGEQFSISVTSCLSPIDI